MAETGQFHFIVKNMLLLEALTAVLQSYVGTVLVASHDRTFVSETANRLVFFENKSLTTFEGSWPEWEKAQHRDRTREDMQLEITRLQMRLAVLTSRMSAPKKGDSPEKLNAEYQQVLSQLNALRS